MVTAELRAEISAPKTHRTIRRVRRHRTVSPARSSHRTIKTLVFLLLLALAGNTLLQAFVAKAQYQLNQKEQKISAIDKEINRMYIELADLSSERRIETLAQERLGMHRATSEEIAFLPGENTVSEGEIQSDIALAEMMIASHRPARRTGLSERFVEWLHGFGRTMAGVKPSEFE